jgi:hypothetical protein
MAYDEGLAQRIREALTDQRNLVERKMFDGITFMLRCDERRESRARGSVRNTMQRSPSRKPVSSASQAAP